MTQETVLVEEDGCYVVHVPGFITPKEAEILIAEVEASGPTQLPVVINGIERLQPRLVRWYATAPHMSYTYSGLTLEPVEFSPAMDALRLRLKEQLGVPFLTCLANIYRDGNDSVGLHADAERVLGVDPTIVSISLGVHRTFRLIRKDGMGSVSVPLGGGDMLVMTGATQRRWRHDVPKEPGVKEKRVSLTFRPHVS